MKVKRLVFCLLLSVMLVVTFIPMTAFGAGEDEGGGLDGELPEIIFDGVGEDEDLWSDGTVTYNVTVPDGVEGDFELKVGCGSSADGWDTEFNGGEEYSWDGENLTLDGAKIFERIGEGELNEVTIEATITDADGETILAQGGASIRVAEAHVNYNEPVDHNYVPGQVVTMPSTIEAECFGADYPYGEMVDCQIINMEVIEPNPEEAVIESLEYDDESGNWVCTTKGLGSALIKVTYKDIDEKEQTCTFRIYVQEAIYGLGVYEENDQSIGLPGDSLHLVTDIWKQTEDNSYEGQEVEDVDYVWTIIEGEDFADVEADTDDPSKAVLTFKESEDSALDEYVTVRVSVKEKVSGEEQASQEISFRVKSEYYALELSDPEAFDPNLAVGENMTITPVLNHYKVNQDVEVVEGAQFSVGDYDEDCLTVTQNEDGTFTIERLDAEGSDFGIVASMGEGEEEIVKGFSLNSLFDDSSDYEDENQFAEPDEEAAIEIEPGKEEEVDTEEQDGLFKFTATQETAGKYVFYSRTGDNYCDPVGRVVDLSLSEEEQVVAGDQSAYENFLGLEGITPDDFMIYFDAEAGQTYYLQAITDTGTGEFTVGLIKSDISDISYKQVTSPYPLRADIDVYTEKDEDGNEVQYWSAEYLEEGDELEVTRTDGKTTTYVFKSLSDGEGSGDSDWCFVNKSDANDVLPAVPIMEEVTVSEDHTVGNTIETYVKYAGCTAPLQFKIIDNPIDTIEVSTDTITAELATFDDEDEADEYLAGWDDVKFTVTTKAGESNEYVFNAEQFEDNTFFGWLYCEETDDSFRCTCGPWGCTDEGQAWEVGGKYTTTIKAAGQEFDINVDVIEHEHEWGTYIEPATLDDNGVNMQQCEVCGETKDEEQIAQIDEDSLRFAAVTYNGKAQVPKVTINDINGSPIDAKYYSVSCSNNVKAGTAAKAIITFKGNYYGSLTKNFTIKKANQRMTVKAATKTLKAKKLKKKAQTVAAISVSRQGAAPTYRKLSGAGKLTVNAKTGKITVKKKTKKGTYRIRVRVTSGATANYNAAYRDVTVTVKVKK